MFWGHSENEGGQREPLADHLKHVRRRAGEFARASGMALHAEAAGLLHDLGKYADRFRRRIEGGGRAGDHSAAGAAVALSYYRQRGLPLAATILAHHGGLEALPTRWEDLAKRLADRFQRQPECFTDANLNRLVKRFQQDGFTLPSLAEEAFSATAPAAAMLDVRMLFSALVDADYLETEAHFNGTVEQPRRPREYGPALEPERALPIVLEKIDSLAAEADPEDPVQAMRSSLRDQVLAAAHWRPGCYTLSAPTGAGKTLAMLAFALQHALAHPEYGFRRVVMVIPYLSIIEQTAKVYRDLLAPHFKPEYVLEDHSLARLRDEGDEAEHGGLKARQRLLAENWDAPLVLTTSVQALESLMDNRPTRCRKLHRLARSIVLFDEVQTLPPALAISTLATLKRLSGRHGATVVFSTATQPAFDVLNEQGAVEQLGGAGWSPAELVRESGSMFAVSADRTKVSWRLDEPVPWDQMIEELARPENERVLCIVNLKRHARELARRLRDYLVGFEERLFHLSTSMCPRHRERVMAEVHRRLELGEPCRLISTQCVEAGVDVDFPRVYRALAPLESLAQAAGRCNRHGWIEMGQVIVFRPEEEAYPPGWYKQASQITRQFLERLRDEGVDIDHVNVLSDPEHLRAYYRHLYQLTNLAGEAQQQCQGIHQAIRERDFQEVAKRYRLIDQDAVNVVVPEDRQAFNALRDDLLERGVEPMRPEVVRQWIARAQPLAVGIPRPRRDDPAWNVLQPVRFGYGDPDSAEADWCLLLEPEDDAGRHYDPELLGLLELEADWIA